LDRYSRIQSSNKKQPKKPKKIHARSTRRTNARLSYQDREFQKRSFNGMSGQRDKDPMVKTAEPLMLGAAGKVIDQWSVNSY